MGLVTSIGLLRFHCLSIESYQREYNTLGLKEKLNYLLVTQFSLALDIIQSVSLSVTLSWVTRHICYWLAHSGCENFFETMGRSVCWKILTLFALLSLWLIIKSRIIELIRYRRASSQPAGCFFRIRDNLFFCCSSGVLAVRVVWHQIQARTVNNCQVSTDHPGWLIAS